MLFSLRSTTKVGFPLGYMIFPATGFLVRLTVSGISSFLWSDLKSKPKAAGYPDSIHATMASKGTSYQQFVIEAHRIHN